MRLALVFIFSLLTGCAGSRPDDGIDPGPRTDTVSDQRESSWTKERKARYDQAREGLRQSQERYIATTRPVLERMFRQEYPELTDTEIEAMVNDALAKGYHPETKSRPEGPARLPPPRPTNCLSPPGSWPSNPNCY
jgi:hypothetical protein